MGHFSQTYGDKKTHGIEVKELPKVLVILRVREKIFLETLVLFSSFGQSYSTLGDNFKINKYEPIFRYDSELIHHIRLHIRHGTLWLV